MRFSFKWSQNVSKYIALPFQCVEQMVFTLRMCYLKNYILKLLTPHILKCEFSQPGGTGVDVTQKRKVVLI